MTDPHTLATALHDWLATAHAQRVAYWLAVRELTRLRLAAALHSMEATSSSAERAGILAVVAAALHQSRDTGPDPLPPAGMFATLVRHADAPPAIAAAAALAHGSAAEGGSAAPRTDDPVPIDYADSRDLVGRARAAAEVPPVTEAERAATLHPAAGINARMWLAAWTLENCQT